MVYIANIIVTWSKWYIKVHLSILYTKVVSCTFLQTDLVNGWTESFTIFWYTCSRFLAGFRLSRVVEICLGFLIRKKSANQFFLLILFIGVYLHFPFFDLPKLGAKPSIENSAEFGILWILSS